ncbi:hypothetical protein THASP1DRAFT_28454 [Thamnocephalis sphaerospora]|uniref:Fe2OG dioxygenase domain-containing protein n=1 Tax=Thamnocephalis sphaerospora TaxID=78915 RepID=A0A4P9XUU1_9FUNG|nr:hypothetical protein THASP1DRAFT_28454 [Thamnocephalis sphaerospora]|eukprot:RKP09742.1 hypothetical protein THASP1DRAFT_28454 [Thamnocephalis sphaerospora]
MTVIDLPIIDFGAYLDPSSTAEQRQAIDHAIDKACRQFGVFHLINHGIPQELCNKVNARARQFFDLSFEEKRKHRVGSDIRGYWCPTDTSNAHNIPCEGIAFYPPVNYCSNGLSPDIDPASPEARLPTTPDVLGGQNSWPSDEFRAQIEEYLEHILPLKDRLFSSIAASLGLGDASQKRMHKTAPHVSFNGYKALTKAQMEEGEHNLAAHIDPGCIAILTQDSDSVSLQIQDKDGKWCGVKPIPGSFIINIGGALSRLTGGQYVDVLHRVIHRSEKPRISIVVFINPLFDITIEPFTECAEKADPAKIVLKTYGEFYLNQDSE